METKHTNLAPTKFFISTYTLNSQIWGKIRAHTKWEKYFTKDRTRETIGINAF